MSKAKLVRRTLRGLLLAAPTVPLIVGCGPIERKDVFSRSDAVFADGGTDTSSDCMELCKTIILGKGFSVFSNIKDCSSATTDAGESGVYCDYTIPSEGRLPPGAIAWGSVRTHHPVGLLFAAASQLEAASVIAFRQLARELSAHQAPRGLVEQARRAAREEVGHAVAMGRLARRYGAKPGRPVVSPAAIRSLEELAVDNAAEGCVRETHGAAIAAWQAQCASDPVIRQELARIAEEELRHAELSWRLDGWLQPRLSADGRHRAAQARGVAVDALRNASQVEPHESWTATAGLPGSTDAQRMTEVLAAQLWG